MNPNAENQHQPEVLTPAESGEGSSDQIVEKSVASSPESKPQTISAALSSQAAQAAAQPSQAVTTAMTDDVAAVPAPQPVNANDSDRIEKEWVDRAKEVIERTRDDPYEQKKEMSKVKADYVQKRFNKSLRLDDAVAK